MLTICFCALKPFFKRLAVNTCFARMLDAFHHLNHLQWLADLRAHFCSKWTQRNPNVFCNIFACILPLIFKIVRFAAIPVGMCCFLLLILPYKAVSKVWVCKSSCCLCQHCCCRLFCMCCNVVLLLCATGITVVFVLLVILVSIEVSFVIGVGRRTFVNNNLWWPWPWPCR